MPAAMVRDKGPECDKSRRRQRHLGVAKGYIKLTCGTISKRHDPLHSLGLGERCQI